MRQATERTRNVGSVEGAESLSAEVVVRLEEEILNGLRMPGDRLDERQLAEHFGMSRTPVREALHRLAASGLAVSRGRQGLQVAHLSLADLLDAFSAVAELEALAARQAARRITADQRRLLLKAHELCEAANASGDAPLFCQANREFHTTIAAASHNITLQEELRRLTLKVAPYRRALTDQPGRMASSVPEHCAVMDAIFAGDGGQASSIMRQHVTLLGGRLSDLLHFLRFSQHQLVPDFAAEHSLTA
ncbi:GntR family transcriptional regulator [Aureimonas fodinaquatilis]|uniref:GntR family transcriptional regulator n=1 Tax=Aureimonas fodinaquatilis TaxID=2565783 RepID=A0A5B0DZC6_9HYPH|nr:GntR family transcriptional regulator [Aureimonas fodinaquatilis]KAA0970900.1 GntR family transcriptional regulator [Aureimonas fodinaquatilis]